MATELKSDFLFDHLRRFLETDEGTKRRKKINFVYRFNIAPKVNPVSLYYDLCVYFFGHSFFVDQLQKMGIDEVTYTVNLKTGEVIKGLDFLFCVVICLLFQEFFMIIWSDLLA